MAYLIPDPPPQGSRLIAAYDNSRRSLLELGLSTSPGPDLAELRRYLAIRQRAEEMAAAEQAMAEGVTGGRRRLFGGSARDEVADPQLRPVSWAVSLRRDRRDLEDAPAHRGLEAHAYYVNAASSEPAVCGHQPRTRKAPGGGRVASLTPACTEHNSRCRKCLVLLYRAALTGEAASGPWPTGDAQGSAAQPALADDAEAVVTGPLEQPPATEPVDLDMAAAGAGQDDEPYLAYPPYGEPLGHAESTAEPAGVAETPADYADEPTAEPPALEAVGELAEEPAAETDLSEAAAVGEGLEVEAVSEAVETAEARDAADELDGAESAAALEAVEAADQAREPVVIPIAEDWDAGQEEILAAEQELDVRVEEFAEIGISPIPGAPDPLEALLEQGVSDVLVVIASGQSALIVGGVGRGTDWAGTMLDMEQEQMLRGTWGSNYLVQRDWPEPQRVCGPYWARAAVLVPVAESVTVIFGAAVPFEVPEQELVDAARTAAARFSRPSPEVTIADEREVSVAIRRIMEGADLSFEAALDHVLNTAASVLGCSVGAGYARMGRRMAMRAVDLDGADQIDPTRLLGSQAVGAGEVIVVEDAPRADEQLHGLVASMRLPLRGANVQGVLVLSHTHLRPRGFTTQDRRLAEALAPAAVLVLERAGFGEGLRALESHLRTAPAADPLTGVANQAAWEEALANEADRLARYGGSAAVAAFKIDGLARIDEREGPQARDAALRRAAELVRAVSRSTDLIARVGDDEFRILVRNSGNQGGRRLATRVRRAARAARENGDGLPPLTISWANARSRSQLLQAGRLVAQRLRARSRAAEPARVGSGRPS